MEEAPVLGAQPSLEQRLKEKKKKKAAPPAEEALPQVVSDDPPTALTMGDLIGDFAKALPPVLRGAADLIDGVMRSARCPGG